MIEIRVPAQTLMNVPAARGESFGQAIDRHVLTWLKEAGAPVEGVLVPKLSRGLIARSEDFESNVIVFRWVEA